jgi:hypothetical protein
MNLPVSLASKMSFDQFFTEFQQILLNFTKTGRPLASDFFAYAEFLNLGVTQPCLRQILKPWCHPTGRTPE